MNHQFDDSLKVMSSNIREMNETNSSIEFLSDELKEMQDIQDTAKQKHWI